VAVLSHDCLTGAYINMYNNYYSLYLDVRGDDVDVLVRVVHVPAPPLQRVVQLHRHKAHPEVEERVPQVNLMPVACSKPMNINKGVIVNNS
jgi:hypothetical protein